MSRHSLVLGRFYKKGSADLYQLGAPECLVIVVLVLITRVLPFPPSRQGSPIVGVRVGLWSAVKTSVVRISIYCRQYRIQIWNYRQCYILLSKRASAPLLLCLVSYTSLPRDSFDQL